MAQPRLLAAPPPAPKRPLPPSDVDRGPDVRLRGAGSAAVLPPELQEEEAVTVALGQATGASIEALCAGLRRLMPDRQDDMIEAMERVGWLG